MSSISSFIVLWYLLGIDILQSLETCWTDLPSLLSLFTFSVVVLRRQEPWIFNYASVPLTFKEYCWKCHLMWPYAPHGTGFIMFWMTMPGSVTPNLFYIVSEYHASKKSRWRDELYLCWVPVICIPPFSLQGYQCFFIRQINLNVMYANLHVHNPFTWFARHRMPLIAYAVTRLWLGNHLIDLGKTSQTNTKISLSGEFILSLDWVFCFMSFPFKFLKSKMISSGITMHCQNKFSFFNFCWYSGIMKK